MYIPRILNLKELLKKKTYFLFGPRQTGKSWLIQRTLDQYTTYDLLDNETYLNLAQNPKRLEEEWDQKSFIIVIDEIQKLPLLLNQVHRMIEKYGIHFLLTGSSARKLRRGGINLLGGRARSKILHPLIYIEIKKQFQLNKALNRGLLPAVYFSDAPEEDLKAYAGDYLRQEIAAEGLTRNVPAFSRFLEVAALCNGTMINYSNIASDAQVPRRTVQEYFQILLDTLLVFEVPAWKASVRRKPVNRSKFYFFDTGVLRYLQCRSEVKAGSPEFGELFVTYLAHELKAFTDYQGGRVHYWRSTLGYEVDFILNEETAIEVKAKKNITDRDLSGLKALRDEKKFKQYIIVTLEKNPRKVGYIHILPWQTFLDMLWD